MPCKLLAYNSLKSHFLTNELHIKAFFFQCRDAAGRAVVPGAPELLEPEQPVSSLLSNTFLGACFISPMRCSAVPHFNLFVFCFGIFFRLDLSLSLINFCCLYGFLLLFFSFSPSFLAFCVALREQIIKGSLLQEAAKKDFCQKLREVEL